MVLNMSFIDENTYFDSNSIYSNLAAEHESIYDTASIGADDTASSKNASDTSRSLALEKASITVEGGVATLTGVVDEGFERAAIEFAARRLEGVSAIRNLLVGENGTKTSASYKTSGKL